ncbi:hypothetical protein Tco_1048713 [Tanacetum coccineum]
MAYPLSSDTAYPDFCPIQRINPNRLIRRIHFHWIRRIDHLEQKQILKKAPIESNLSITSNGINIELSKEFFVELRKNIYHGMHNEDVVDHIVKVLKMVDLIYVSGVDSHQLRMKVFPLSLANDAKEWSISKEITTWEELVEKFFYRFYPESYDREDEMLDEEENWGIDPLEFLSNINTSFKNNKKVDRRTQKVIFHAWVNGN